MTLKNTIQLLSKKTQKKTITVRDLLSCLEIRLIEALRNPRAPTVPECRFRGMADSASHAACGQRAATQRHRWTRANEHIVASIFKEEEPQLEDNSENDLRMSQTRPGGRPVRWNLADGAWPTVGEIRISQAGSRLPPVTQIHHGPGAVDPAGAGRAPLARVGSTRKVTFFSFFRGN